MYHWKVLTRSNCLKHCFNEECSLSNQLKRVTGYARSLTRNNVCDRIWEKVHYGAYFQNQVIGITGQSKVSAIKCTTRFVIKVTCCGVMAVSIH